MTPAYVEHLQLSAIQGSLSMHLQAEFNDSVPLSAYKIKRLAVAPKEVHKSSVIVT